MLSFIVGGVSVVAGAVATAGATASVWRGVVRGAGRLMEGDPMAAVKEVGGGIVEPVAIAGTQIMNLAHDVANVAVYAGASVAGLLSPQAKSLVERIGSFDNTVAAVILASTLPELPGGPPAEAPRPVAATA
jgi:hypothetical protein